MTKKQQKGFTLVELMIVVAIIGVLAAVAIPKFADMLEKSREGATKGNLGAIRSAVSNYYADQSGVYPGYLDTNSWSVLGCTAPCQVYVGFIPKYLDSVSPVKVTAKNTVNPLPGSGPGVGPLAASVLFSDWSTVASWKSDGTAKGWRYNELDGQVWVNSNAIDMAGNSYTTYGF